MKNLRFLSAVLPLFALAACTDHKTNITEPVQIITLKSRGEIVATQLCGQCHGTDFLGKTVGATFCPALDIVGTFSLAHFEDVLNAETADEGSAMVSVASAVKHLSAQDRQALYEYLASLLQLP